MTQLTPLNPDLYQARPVSETIAVYDEWAATYDGDLEAKGYHTPTRVAAAIKPYVPRDTVILDFGCGTGVSGAALKAEGFNKIHGTDVTQGMLDQAETKGIYDKLWLGDVHKPPCETGAYKCILAVGVISLAAAPPDTLAEVLGVLPYGGILALSFNDPSLAAGTYDAALDRAVSAGRATVLFREHGPHIDKMNMGCDVIVLQRL